MYQRQTRYATKLITKAIDCVEDASIAINTIETRGSDKLVPIVLEPGRNSCSFYICIPNGFKALVTSNQRYIGIWDPGFHFARPWEMVSSLVTEQYIVYDTPVKECPTMDNVMVEVDVSVVFHIKDEEEDVRNFVYKLGPVELENMLHAYQEEAVRAMARQKKYSSIYDLMDMEELELPQKVAAANDKAEIEPAVGELASEPVLMPGQTGGNSFEMQALKQNSDYSRLTEKDAKEQEDDTPNVGDQLENTKRSMNKRLNTFGVNVYSITITNVVLPNEFRAQMEDATTFDSKNRRAHAEQQFLILVQNDQETREKARQLLREELAEAQAKNEQRIANEMKITNKFEAETEKLIAGILEEQNAQVRHITTAGELEVARLEKAKELELASLGAEANAEVARIKTEMEAYIMTVKANADAEVKALEAEELKIIAEAEGHASSKLAHRRDYQAKMSQLRVLQNLGQNDQVVVSGTNKDSVVAQLVGAKNSSLALGLNAE